VTPELIRQSFSIDGILLPMTSTTIQTFTKDFAPGIAQRTVKKADETRAFARKAVSNAYDSIRAHAHYIDMNIESPEIVLEEAHETVHTALNSCKLIAASVGTLTSRYKHIRATAKEKIQVVSREELVGSFEVYYTANLLVMRLEYRRQALEQRIERLVQAQIAVRTKIYNGK